MAPKNKNKGKPRNYKLVSGVSRFGKSSTYHKKAIYKFLKKKTAKKADKPAPRFIEKKVGGAKNGGTRMVRVKKFLKESDYPTKDKPAPGTSKKFFAKQTHKIRPTLCPGTVSIILAGVHKGKRVIVLKHLSTGLLLVTGPFKINGCPMRRINQRYLVATSTHIDVSAVKIADKINDDYFRRVRRDKKTAKKEGDIFESKKESYKASDERKKDQVDVDTQILAVIKKHKESAMLRQYLRHNFTLSKGQFPHKLAF
jgi:large subunit ribosomal protein L6e